MLKAGIGIMAQMANLSLPRTGILYGHLFMTWLHHFPSSSPLVAWKSSGERSKSLRPCTSTGDLEKVPDTWLQVSSSLAVMTIWGNEPVDGGSLFVSYFPHKSAIAMKINKSLKKCLKSA